MRRAWLLLLAATACAPPGGVGRARTLPSGSAQLSGGVEMSIASADRAAEKPVPLPWMVLSAGYRRGVTGSLDLGARAWAFGVPALWTWGVQADAKWQLRRPSPGRSSIAVAAGISYGQMRNGGTPTHTTGVMVPLLIGKPLGRHELVWGPRVGWQLIFGEGQHPVDLPMAGASLGFAWKLGRHLELMPELVILYTPVSMSNEAIDAKAGTWSTQLSLGGIWSL